MEDGLENGKPARRKAALLRKNWKIKWGNGSENEERKQTYSKAILEIEETALVDRFLVETKGTEGLKMNVRFPAERVGRPLKKQGTREGKGLFRVCMEKWVRFVLVCFGFFWEIQERGERRREILICCSTHPCSHWLILVCALTGDQTLNLGASGQH